MRDVFTFCLLLSLLLLTCTQSVDLDQTYSQDKVLHGSRDDRPVNGNVVSYFPNGVVSSVIKYNNGLSDGMYQTFDQAGNIVQNGEIIRVGDVVSQYADALNVSPDSLFIDQFKEGEFYMCDIYVSKSNHDSAQIASDLADFEIRPSDSKFERRLIVIDRESRSIIPNVFN